MHPRSLKGWRCLIWPTVRLLIWIVAVFVITVVITKTGLDLPAATGVVVGGVFVSRELYRWIVRGETPPEIPITA